MKYGLRIGLLGIWVLLLHDVCMQVTGEDHLTCTAYSLQEQHSLSQDRPMHDAIECLYLLYACQPCDVSHTEDNHIPADKALQLLTARFSTPGAHHLPASLSTPHAPSPPSHPVVHYVYGLHKIVI